MEGEPGAGALVPASPTGPVGDEHEPEPVMEWDWQSCLPKHGEEKFVAALQMLGMDMAKAVPLQIQDEAIFIRQPVSDLLRGRFGKKTTKERLLNLGLSCLFLMELDNAYMFHAGAAFQGSFGLLKA